MGEPWGSSWSSDPRIEKLAARFVRRPVTFPPMLPMPPVESTVAAVRRASLEVIADLDRLAAEHRARRESEQRRQLELVDETGAAGADPT